MQDKDAKEKLKCLQLEVQALKEKLQSEEDCSLATEQELNEEVNLSRSSVYGFTAEEVGTDY